MKKFSLSIIILFVYLPGFAQKTHQQKINDWAVLTFPDAVKEYQTATGHIYYCNSNGVLYDAQSVKIDSTADEKRNGINPDSIYHRFIGRLLLSNKGQIVSEKPVLFDDMLGWELDIAMPSENKTIHNIQRVFIFNGAILSFSVWSDDPNKISEEKRSEFFNSLLLTFDRNQLIH